MVVADMDGWLISNVTKTCITIYLLSRKEIRSDVVLSHCGGHRRRRSNETITSVQKIKENHKIDNNFSLVDAEILEHVPTRCAREIANEIIMIDVKHVQVGQT